MCAFAQFRVRLCVQVVVFSKYRKVLAQVKTAGYHHYYICPGAGSKDKIKMCGCLFSFSPLFVIIHVHVVYQTTHCIKHFFFLLLIECLITTIINQRIPDVDVCEIMMECK